MLSLHTTLIFLFLSSSLANAGDVNNGGACNINNNRLQIGTYEFSSDCNSVTYCNATTSTCQKKGCRRDQYPFGYAVGANLPPLCGQGEFCPDEEDACQPLLAVGSDCQLNRDGTTVSLLRIPKKVLISAQQDECQPPPDAKSLTDNTGHGLNVDGAVCLNFQCM